MHSFKIKLLNENILEDKSNLNKKSDNKVNANGKHDKSQEQHISILKRKSQNDSKTQNARMHFINLFSEDNIAAFKIQWEVRRWLIKRHLTELKHIKTQKFKQSKIILYGSSSNSNSKKKMDFDKLKEMLELIDLEFEVRDLYLNPAFIRETDKYGGPNNLPFVIVNDINIGGKSQVSELIDLRILRDIATMEYLDRWLKWNVKRINSDAQLWINCYESYMFFKVEPLSIQVDNRMSRDMDSLTPTKHKSYFYDNLDESNFHTAKAKTTKSFIIDKRSFNNNDIDKTLNKSQMIIEDNILDEFLGMDNTFELAARNLSPDDKKAKQKMTITRQLEFDEFNLDNYRVEKENEYDFTDPYQS